MSITSTDSPSPVSPETDRPVPLRRQRDYRLLWSARAVSETGSEVARLAVPLTAATLLTASPIEMGLLTAASTVPFLLVGLPSGALADRVARRRPVMVACEAFAGLAVLSVPAAWLGGLLTIPWLIAVALVVGVCTVVFRSFNTPHLMSVVAPSQRTTALAGFQSVFSVAEMCGPSLAGLLVTLLTAPIAIVVNAVTFLASALCLKGIRAPEHGTRGSGRGILREIAEGVSVLMKHGALRALCATGMLVNFLGAAQLALYVLFAVRVLGLPGALVGVTATGFGVGGLLGAVLASRLARRFGENRVLLGSVLFFPVGFVTTAAAGGPFWLVVCQLVAAEVITGVAVVCYSVCAGAVTMRESPAELLGRVNATTNFATQGVMAPGGVLGGLLGASLGLRPALWVCAAAALLIIPCLWLSPIRRGARPASAAGSPSTARRPRSGRAAARR
ncbi:MFS transporter [Sphaerimonospora thailandensis]|uniref:MFS transporter n=1 Tax=Sphaerimonospora thailandensis TaxID=795644 RepID=A0A8J3RDD6_9ACTN|nr:MFS transporter [Sphaerimonospora thailandensis]GIH72700.1 MFS transporter [Sphaerimonospora thailandensis]